MKKIQPEVDKLRQRYKDDPAKQQSEMMALWQRERINPVMGCLPMLATIPVFLALFKVLSVTIEMRHAHFLGLQDLSAPDPTTIWNLFGLLPYDPSHLPMLGGLLGGGGFLHIGVFAITYAFTTWVSQSMTPTTGMDPTQQKMMQLMPWFFMFIMARFTVGLLIYYTWSNTLTVLQQYVIMRRFKVENPIDRIIARLKDRLRPRPTG
jgi:YidC/Oxa1 family membrane protein insertase